MVPSVTAHTRLKRLQAKRAAVCCTALWGDTVVFVALKSQPGQCAVDDASKV